MDLQLTGKRAIISGGGKGLGLAAARALAREGVVVAIVARGDYVDQVAADLSAETGTRVIGLRADTTDDESVRAMVDAAVAQLGGVDILVNTAATPWTPDMNTTASTTSDEQMLLHFNTKSVGYLRTARAVAPHMKAQGWGRIINVAGLGARAAGSVAQTVRNVAVSAITKNLADELGRDGINVTVVHPAATRTPGMTARLEATAAETGTSVAELEQGFATNSINRLVDETEVADVIAFLASPRSVAITGDAIAVGGGAPGPIYY